MRGFAIWLVLLLATAGCTTRQAWQPPFDPTLVSAWEATAYAAPRLHLVTIAVEEHPWHSELTSWRHSQELLDHVFARWLQLPDSHRHLLAEPNHSTLAQLFTQELPARLGDDDLTVLYLGTHQLSDGRLLLADDSHIQARDLGYWLNALPGRVLLLADVCYANRLQDSANFSPQVAQIYATGDHELAPEVPLDTSLRELHTVFGETHTLIHHQLGLPYQRYSYLGLAFTHALRQELAEQPPELRLDRLTVRMIHQQTELAPRVRRIQLPVATTANLQPWTLATAAAIPVATAGDLPTPKTLEELLALPPEQIDVGLGNLLIGRQLDSATKLEPHLKRLDEMAASLRQRIDGERDPQRVIATLNHYLFEELELQALDAPYTRDFLLHDLLSERQGRCSALVSLYLALGQRLGLPLRSVCIPEHIFVRWERQPDDDWDWPGDLTQLNIETTRGGIHLTDEQYRAMHPWRPTKQSFYLQSLDARETVGTLFSPLASALLRQGLAEEAAAAGREAVRINPADAEAWNNLGMARRQQEQDALALACYRRALAIHPTFAEAWNNLGSLQSKPADRLRYYRQAVQLKPSLGEAWRNIAYAAFDLGDYQQAAAAVQRCRELDTTVPATFLQALDKRLTP